MPIAVVELLLLNQRDIITGGSSDASARAMADKCNR